MRSRSSKPSEMRPARVRHCISAVYVAISGEGTEASTSSARSHAPHLVHTVSIAL